MSRIVHAIFFFISDNRGWSRTTTAGAVLLACRFQEKHSAQRWRQICHRLKEEQHHFCNINMQTIVDDLAQSLIRSSNDKGKRVLVGLCGTPGSGKSQLARHVVERINGILGNRIAVVVGMDGWHLTRAQLAQMPDPQLAKDRRGAAWTFDDKVC